MSKPNILWIMADQFRADALSCAGGPGATPNLDALAREGVRFSNCSTVAPLCVPARISMMTGKYPHTTGAWDNAACALSPEANLWTRAIAAQGYAASVFGKLHLHTNEGDMISREYLVKGYGFETVDETAGPHSTAFSRTHYSEYLARRGLLEDYRRDMERRGKTPHAAPSPLPLDSYYDVYVGDRGREYLQNYQGDRPWFCHVSFGGPHEPWDTPEPYASLYKPEDMPEPLPPVQDRCPDRPQGEHDARRRKPQLQCDAQTAREIRANYAGGCTLIDEKIGEILDTIRARGEWDNTVVLFTSDHGELNGDHGYVNKRNFFRPVLNIPLIIRTPDTARQGGRVSDALVSLLDIGPTLAELAGAELDYIQFGRSLCPILDGEAQSVHDSILSEYAGELMYMDNEWKMVVNKSGQPYLLFHLTEDPAECDNLIGDPAYASLTQELTLRLFRLMADTACLKPSPILIAKPRPSDDPALQSTAAE